MVHLKVQGIPIGDPVPLAVPYKPSRVLHLAAQSNLTGHLVAVCVTDGEAAIDNMFEQAYSLKARA